MTCDSSNEVGVIEGFGTQVTRQKSSGTAQALVLQIFDIRQLVLLALLVMLCPTGTAGTRSKYSGSEVQGLSCSIRLGARHLRMCMYTLKLEGTAGDSNMSL
jgi:hypothetical protein